MEIPAEVYGPFGLLVALLLGIGYVVRLLVGFVREYIADLRAQRDVALTANRSLEASLATMAKAMEQDVRDRARRHRGADE